MNDIVPAHMRKWLEWANGKDDSERRKLYYMAALALFEIMDNPNTNQDIHILCRAGLSMYEYERDNSDGTILQTYNT